MADITVADLLGRHAEYLKNHKPIPTLQEIAKAGGRLTKVAVITCADPRCIPEQFLKLDIGDAVVYRVPGGKPELMEGGILSVDTLATFNEIMIVQHTDCGTLAFRDEGIKLILKERAPDKSAEIDRMIFGETTSDMEQSIRDSVRYLRSSPYLRPALRTGVTGYLYDLKSGQVKQIE